MFALYVCVSLQYSILSYTRLCCALLRGRRNAVGIPSVEPLVVVIAAAFRTEILHVCGLDSIRILLHMGWNSPKRMQPHRKFDPKDLSTWDVGARVLYIYIYIHLHRRPHSVVVRSSIHVIMIMISSNSSSSSSSSNSSNSSSNSSSSSSGSSSRSSIINSTTVQKKTTINNSMFVLRSSGRSSRTSAARSTTCRAPRSSGKICYNMIQCTIVWYNVP